ncbi:hypothetical protein Patl1_20022 [Pistacia atlantica]|uniref:Uncharacterized protein n=1 Tax=Pistacia atlantica TaxID=434234 RepID=A0ACC1BM37_9ROSI|nr:hypothetical protein Patl1_20022 [Pistacia atlantica]
MCLRNWKWADI